MFSELSGNLSEIPAELRPKLAALLDDRAQMMVHQMELLRRKAELLRNPSDEAENDLTEFASIVLRPLRIKEREQTAELFQEAVDVDKLKGLLPMILMGLMSGVNVPLLFNVLGADPDMISDMVTLGKRYFAGTQDDED